MKFLAQIVSEYIPFYARIATLPPPLTNVDDLQYENWPKQTRNLKILPLTNYDNRRR